MRLLAPCAGAAEVEPLLRGGADELYCGVYDRRWAERWGLASWPNRRGPGPGNLPSVEALSEVCAEAHAGGATVQLTLNAPFYSPEQEDTIVDLAGAAVQAGIDGLIVGSPALLRRLRATHPDATLVASTLCATRNAATVRFLARCGADRVILSRQLTLAEIHQLRAATAGVELEAFVLNDACAFEEGCCASAHQLPGSPHAYCLAPWPRPDGVDPRLSVALEAHRAHLQALARRDFTHEGGLPLGPCGLCALPELDAAGLDGVKVVGREAHPYRKVRSVQMVRHVLDALGRGGAELARERALALRDDADGCRGGLACYYPEVRPIDG